MNALQTCSLLLTACALLGRAPLVFAQGDRMLTFDGDDVVYVAAPIVGASSNSMTAAATIRLSALPAPGSSYTILAYEDTGGSTEQAGRLFVGDDGRLRYAVETAVFGGFNNVMPSPDDIVAGLTLPPLALGQSLRVAVTVNGSTDLGHSVRLFVDGASVEYAIPVGGNRNLLAQPLQGFAIGKAVTSGPGAPDGFIGDIDEVSLWSRPLGKVELASVASGPISCFTPGLIGHWRFNEVGAVQEVVDESPLGHDGQLGLDSTSSGDPLRSSSTLAPAANWRSLGFASSPGATLPQLVVSAGVPIPGQSLTVDLSAAPAGLFVWEITSYVAPVYAELPLTGVLVPALDRPIVFAGVTDTSGALTYGHSWASGGPCAEVTLQLAIANADFTSVSLSNAILVSQLADM